MSANGQARPAIVHSGAGKPIDFGPGRDVSVMLDGDQTGGALAMLLVTLPPGFGPPTHVHARDDEVFLVAEGTISYSCDGAWTDVGPGGVVYLPKGTPHRFRNNGATPARHWVIVTPSGFERFFAQSAEAVTRPGGPDRARLAALEAEYGYTMVDEA